ncbi:single-stranded DNA-binding protein, partial [Klebsiella grimontii]|nr:single-stranded DNA-binding protein [Klebsiella grimontii]
PSQLPPQTFPDDYPLTDEDVPF